MTEPRISRADVEHVARLSRLELAEAELLRMQAELSNILAYIDKLRSVDTAGVEPTSHAVPPPNEIRADELRPACPLPGRPAKAPDPVGDYFRVPRIIEE